ncbi:SDR family oxidoreductase [Bradyrhizobium sp. 169]|uniref:SDR family oxidoreductase n=1 Tax=Bradyrhizobium sp. 169 TaxID=2782640 RepID=UPI001FFB6888|nr:SDR family oxidoreductase [Bradyrhizobium sp. 169]
MVVANILDSDRFDEDQKTCSGKVVLVTGATRGLGRATAEAFLRVGAHVIATGRDRKEMARVRDAFDAIGGHYNLISLEVTDEHAIVDLVASLKRLDVVVNNAGIAQKKPFLETTSDDLRGILEVNVVGAFIVMREAIRKMLELGGGQVINIASDAALHGNAQMAPYVASKHALLGMSRAARLEMNGRGIRIATVCPGPINTEILGPGSLEEAIHPRDLAKAIVCLASLPDSFEVQELLAQPTRMRSAT